MPIGFQPLDRLVRKEVSLGAIREREVPAEHIGLRQIAPFLEVATDDVIFEYIKQNTENEGMAPARAEDAEAELAQADALANVGQGRASVIDWALKDKYTASDVTRYREDLLIQERLGNDVNLQLDRVGNSIRDFQSRVARDDARRRRRLDNRLEFLIMQAVETGGITYNDGKIKFTVNFGRPADQQNIAPAGGLWNTPACDPIGDILAFQEFMYNRYGFRPRRAIVSRRIINSLWKSERFLAALGMPVIPGGTTNVPLDVNYLGLNGYNPEGALRVVEAATGVQFQEYDAVFKSRPVGSQVTQLTRYLSDNKLHFLPTDGEFGEIIDDQTEIGFAKTLTAPHPEGNFTSGYYEWEDEQRDPWIHVRGSGIKAFPIFPYMELSASMTVL